MYSCKNNISKSEKRWIAGSVHGTLKNVERCGIWLRCIAWCATCQDAVGKSRLFCLLKEDKDSSESSQGTHQSTQTLFKKSGENIKSCSCNAPVNVLAHFLYECQLGLVKGACFVVALHAKPQASGVLTNHSCFQSFSWGSRQHTGTRPFITLAQSIGSLHKAICNYSQLADMNLFKIGVSSIWWLQYSFRTKYFI